MSAPLVDIGQKIMEIERLRKQHIELFSNMNRFTVQTILTYLHHSPMTVDEVFRFQERLTKDITERQVTHLLDDLVDRGFARKVGRGEYVHTDASLKLLESVGVTKEFLFPR